MKRPYLFPLALFCAAVSSAQTPTGVGVSVSRTVTLAMDEAAFAISAAAGLGSTPSQVKQALQSAGLPNPTVVATGLAQDNSAYPPGPALILYSATVALPAASAIDTVKSLETLRARLPDPLRGLQYSVAFNPSQAAVDAARESVMPQLVDDARKQALPLAAAAGVTLGTIRSLSDTAGAYGGDFSALLAVQRVGDFVLAAPYSQPSSAQYTFNLTVVFAAVQ